MALRHPDVSPNPMVWLLRKSFSNPEITCQFIRDMLDLPAKKCDDFEGSNIHVFGLHCRTRHRIYTV